MRHHLVDPTQLIKFLFPWIELKKLCVHLHVSLFHFKAFCYKFDGLHNFNTMLFMYVGYLFPFIFHHNILVVLENLKCNSHYNSSKFENHKVQVPVVNGLNLHHHKNLLPFSSQHLHFKVRFIFTIFLFNLSLFESFQYLHLCLFSSTTVSMSKSKTRNTTPVCV